MGHKRTNHCELKSAFVCFGPKADIRGRNWIVRFVPKATDAPQQIASLFAHLVGAGEQHYRISTPSAFAVLRLMTRLSDIYSF